MYLFKNSSDKWIFGNTVYSECPAGIYKLDPSADSLTVSIRTLERNVAIVSNRPIGRFKKENGEGYTNLAELVAACNGFFQAAGGSSIASAIDGGSASTVF